MVSIAVMVSILLVAIDTTIVTTAMPQIVKQLSGLTLISWVFAIYLLTTAVTTPIYGKLADLFGRKSVFVLGIGLFVLGSMLSGLAQSMQQLIWFRAFQGIGAGAVMPVALTIFGDIFLGEERARMQGLLSSVWGIAALVGPLAGGLFVDHISWRWIFYINVPIGIVAIFLILTFFHETPVEKTKRAIDYWGAIFFTIAMSSLIYTLLSGGETYSWTSLVTIGLFALSLLFLVFFIIVESKAAEPMLPLSLFKIPVIAVSNLVGLIASCVLIGINVYLPIWIQTLLGYSATSSGLTLMPTSLAWTLAATLAGRFMYDVGSKATAVFGAALITAGSAWLVFINTGSPYCYLVGIMIVIGFGLGCTMTPLTVVVQSAVGWNMRGVATASTAFTRTLGQTLGIALFGTIFNNTLNNYLRNYVPGNWNSQDISYALMTKAPGVPGEVLARLQTGMINSLHIVFVLIFIAGLLTLLTGLLLPSHQKVVAGQQDQKG